MLNETFLIESVVSAPEFTKDPTPEAYLDGEFNEQALAIVEPLIIDEKERFRYFQFCELHPESWAAFVTAHTRDIDPRWGQLAKIINSCGY